jgi:hypothetical protein
MSEVMAAIAKVYLTDCFVEKDSQKICEELLDQSLLYDPENPESTQALADLRMSQNRKGEALVMVRATSQPCSVGCIRSILYDKRAPPLIPQQVQGIINTG